MKEEIFVSVICLAYNHEKYIKDALDGFVKQKTKYKYEIIIHDDASTDNTADIIRGYCKKYPSIFIPIFQKENQCTKFRQQGHGSITKDIIYPLIRGKYIAICEGDDFWTDDQLIEKKVTFMESHPEYCAYLHRTKYFDCDKNKFIGFSNPSEKEYDFSYFDAIALKCHTTGWLVKKEIYDVRVPKEVEYLRKLADSPIALWTTYYGKVRYTPEVMSVWRRNTIGSWTKRNVNGTLEQKINFSRKRIKSLKKLKKISDKKYHLFIESKIVEQRIYLSSFKKHKILHLFYKFLYRFYNHQLRKR